MSKTALCTLQNWFWERKKKHCFAVYCCGQTWNSWNYYLFSLLANKLLNHFEVSNLSFSIFCLSAGGGAAGASLMGAPALLGLLPQGGLIQASKEVGSHHSIKRVEWNIPHKKIPIWSVRWVTWRCSTRVEISMCTMQVEPFFFPCSISMYSRKTLHGSSKIFSEHVFNVTRIQLNTDRDIVYPSKCKMTLFL